MTKWLYFAPKIWSNYWLDFEVVLCSILQRRVKYYICLLFAGPWIENDNIWTDLQCENIGITTNINLLECQRQCEQRDMCSAVNYSPTIQNGDCIFRKCGSEVPPPLGNQGDYKGYYMDSNQGKKNWSSTHAGFGTFFTSCRFARNMTLLLLHTRQFKEYLCNFIVRALL